ncbi:MAG: hypothetical protein M1823_003716 [Watsoniomyces obsoletus]|nr:MAG: hypothetical protein M1823_003716 [Watsoniomyces obsoletus]
MGAAKQFEQDWTINPTTLPFAENVHSDALAILLMKGIQLEELENELPGCRNSVSATLFQPTGPTPVTRLENVEDNDVKPDVATLAAGLARLATPSRTTVIETTVVSPSAAASVPREIPHAATTSTHADATSAFQGPTPLIDTGVGEMSFIGWHPKDPSQLATGGSDALSRVYRFEWSQGSVMDPMSATRIDMPSGVSNLWMVTGLAWHPTGQALAVSASSQTGTASGQVSLFDEMGRLVCNYAMTGNVVLSLQWMPSGRALLAATPHPTEVNSSQIIICEARTGDFIAEMVVPRSVIQVAWLDDRRFFLGCTESVMLISFDGRYELLWEEATSDGETIELMRLDPVTRQLATVTYGGMLEIWGREGRRHATSASETVPSAMEWQPLPNSESGSTAEINGETNDDNNSTTTTHDHPRLLATSCIDTGTIKIWDVNNLGSSPLHTLNFTDRHLPVYTLAFSPDGTHLAGASWGKILVWKISQDGRSYETTESWYSPGLARYDGESRWTIEDEGEGHEQGDGQGQGQGEGQQGQEQESSEMTVTMTNGDGHGHGHGHGNGNGNSQGRAIYHQDPQQMLSYNSDGTKMAYAVGHHIAIIPTSSSSSSSSSLEA